jgi:hypothetical protein
MVQIHKTTLLILLWFSAIAVADNVADSVADNEGQNKVRRRHRLLYGVPSDEDVGPVGDIGDDWNRLLDSSDMSMDCVSRSSSSSSKKSKKSKKSRYVQTEYE